MKKSTGISGNFRVVIASVSLLLLTLTGAIAQKRITSLIQISDPQFGMFEDNEGFQKETVLYEKAVEDVNRLNPDFVVITGDFVHDRSSDSQINEFKRITAKIKSEIPVYYTPGNHDIGKIPARKDIKKYRQNYGKDRFSFMYNDNLFIGLNSGIIKAGEPKAEQKQYRWLIRQLKKGRKANQVILFCHYPFYTEKVSEPEKYSNIAPESRKKYLMLFDKYNVNAVFSGHTHENIVNSYNGIELVSTSAVGKPLGKAKSGFRIIKITDNKISHTFIEIQL